MYTQEIIELIDNCSKEEIRLQIEAANKALLLHDEWTKKPEKEKDEIYENSPAR